MAARRTTRNRPATQAPARRPPRYVLALDEPAPLGLGLDFAAERYAVEAAFEHERMHVEQLIAAPQGAVFNYAPWLWQQRNWLAALAVTLIVLAFACWPRPTVRSGWDGRPGIAGQSYVVTPTAAGPPGIAADAVRAP
ncbi:MAG TPA: hypothetical protein VNL77_24425 [Roseiflexaceae bacterium]|nr:hypothetical protein [Roseiflexaceae bacterium]